MYSKLAGSSILNSLQIPRYGKVAGGPILWRKEGIVIVDTDTDTRERQNKKNISDSSWHDIFGYLECTDYKTTFILIIVIEKWPAQGC